MKETNLSLFHGVCVPGFRQLTDMLRRRRLFVYQRRLMGRKSMMDPGVAQLFYETCQVLIRGLALSPEILHSEENKEK